MGDEKVLVFCLISKQFQCMKKWQTVSVKNYFENFQSLSLIIPNYRVKILNEIEEPVYVVCQTGFNCGTVEKTSI